MRGSVGGRSATAAGRVITGEGAIRAVNYAEAALTTGPG